MRGKLTTLFVAALLCIPIFCPTVAGEWSTDTWLSSVISSERIDAGDEFGCHGYEGVDTIEDHWVIDACREYLVGLTPASRWGESPVSFGFRNSIIDNGTASLLANSGFTIVGDMVEEAPDSLYIANRNGASLEKGASDKTLIESAEDDTLVSIHWRARIGDLRVREDKDLISWLEEQRAWFTTWGEWHYHRESGQSIEAVLNGSTVTLEASETKETNLWYVPGTLKIESNSTVISVIESGGAELPLLSGDERKLTVGWRQVDGGIIVTKLPQTTVMVELDMAVDEIETTPLMTFNDLNYSVTIVGHHTSNLFRWTQDFSNSHLSFTWLIERPYGETIGWKLPLFALTLLIAVPYSIFYLIRNDQFSQPTSQDHQSMAQSPQHPLESV